MALLNWRRSSSCCSLLLLPSLTLIAVTCAAAVSLQELPRHPQLECSRHDVRAAFLKCAKTGATPDCCSGLDEVFAGNKPSKGCLCLPQVLYQVTTTASQQGLDVLGLLNKCQRQYSSSFKTQWAAANPTDCPNIPLTSDAGQVAFVLGPEVLLPSARQRPTWAWDNLLQFGEVMSELPDVSGLWDKVFGFLAVRMLLIVIISTGPLFWVMHNVPLLMLSPAYRKLDMAERTIVCQHAVYAVVFGLSLVPQSILAVTALFKAWTGDYLASPQLTVLCAVFLWTRAMLYLIEASTRAVIKRSWLLLVHHQLFFLIVVLGAWTQNTAIVGFGIVLDLFACHEAPLYVALVAYRLNWPTLATRVCLRVAIMWYVITRVFQTVVLMYLIVDFALMPAIRLTPEFIIVAVLCVAFTVIQAYTLVIYRAMDRKVSARLHHNKKVPAAVTVAPELTVEAV